MYISMFTRRLNKLGFTAYTQYLASDHWRQFRKEYFASKTTRKTCVVCKSFHVELHHISYVRLGKEKLKDVIPLCRCHHEEVHNYLKGTNRRVHESRQVIKSIKSGSSLQEEIQKQEVRKAKTQRKREARNVLMELGASLGFADNRQTHSVWKKCGRMVLWLYTTKKNKVESRKDQVFVGLEELKDKLDFHELHRRMMYVSTTYSCVPLAIKPPVKPS